MSALTILIIRHAENGGENWPGPGLTANGMPDEIPGSARLATRRRLGRMVRRRAKRRRLSDP